MKAYPISKVRKIFPKEEYSSVKGYINRINKCIEHALEIKERKIIYLFDRVLHTNEINKIHKIYKDEGYNVELDTTIYEYLKIIISW